LRRSFSLADAPPISSFSSVLSTYLHRAPHTFAHVFFTPPNPTFSIPRTLDIFSISSPAADHFLAGLSALSDFLEYAAPASDKFGAFQLGGLQEIADAYGRTSEQYNRAVEALHAALLSAFAQPDLNIVLLTTDAPASPIMPVKREPQQSPLPPPIAMPPLGSDATCFTDVNACSNSTNACSGHGECVSTSRAGRACFVCACVATKDANNRTEYWAGDACQRKDVSGCAFSFRFLLVGYILRLMYE